MLSGTVVGDADSHPPRLRAIDRHAHDPGPAVDGVDGVLGLDLHGLDELGAGQRLERAGRPRGAPDRLTTGAVCVYPTMVSAAVKALRGTGIPVASATSSTVVWPKVLTAAATCEWRGSRNAATGSMSGLVMGTSGPASR